jgi:type IV pilus secretin PilQ/predicted competence protein
MAGMNIRFARIRNLASSKAKEGIFTILFFMLAFAVPGFANAQDKPDISASTLQSNPASTSSSGSSEQANVVTLPVGSITDVRTKPEDGRTTVIVETEKSLAPTEFFLENPPRLVLDFPNAANKVPFLNLPLDTASIKQIRVRQFQSMPDPIARMVFDLKEDHGAHQITVDKTSVRVVFEEDLPSAGISDKKTPESAKEKDSSKPEEPKVVPYTPKTPVKAAQLEQKSKPEEPKVVPYTPKAPAKAAQLEQKSKPEAPAKSPAIEPKPVSRMQVSKATDPETVPKAPARQASLEPRPVSRTKLPKATAAETAPKAPAAQAPLVAALTPPAIAAAPKAAPAPASRFSGQPLTLDLIDMPLVDFFRLMAEEGGINIVMDPEINGRISIKVVKVPWDQIFEAALKNHGLDKQVEGTLVRIAHKSTLQEEARQQESLKKATLLAADLETKIKRLNYAKAEKLLDALEDQKTVRGTIVVDERTNSLIITDIPSSVRKLMDLIKELDISQPQVEIESRIVSATRDFARDIGIQWGFVQGNLERVTVGGPNTFGTIGGTRPSATPSSTYAAGNPFTGRGASEDTLSESASVSTGSSSSNKGNFNVNLPSVMPFGGVGISVGNIFDTFLLDAAITAGESKGLAKLISQPKVVAQNNSPATITQGLRFPVQVVANNTISVQFQNAALTLVVTPQITYDGNIILDLKVENNTPDFGKAVNNIPSIRTSESETRVLVTDGGTTVIGGILIDDEATTENKVPGLGSLPILGNLFRRNAVSRGTQEILFFVTPRIIK